MLTDKMTEPTIITLRVVMNIVLKLKGVSSCQCAAAVCRKKHILHLDFQARFLKMTEKS